MRPVTVRADRDELPVFIDGRLVGWISNGFKARTLELHLRKLKLQNETAVPDTLEIVHCPLGLDESEVGWPRYLPLINNTLGVLLYKTGQFGTYTGGKADNM